MHSSLILSIIATIFLLNSTSSVLLTPVSGAVLGVSQRLSFKYDLNQKHVPVWRTKAAEYFITGIRNIGIVMVQNSYPGLNVAVINGATAPDLHFHDMKMALMETWIRDSKEAKYYPMSGRQQRDYAAGYAEFSVREQWSGMPIQAGVMPNVDSYSSHVAGFETAFAKTLGEGGWDGVAWYIPCELIPEKDCDTHGPWGLS